MSTTTEAERLIEEANLHIRTLTDHCFTEEAARVKRLVGALRTSEEARVKAERERDEAEAARKRWLDDYYRMDSIATGERHRAEAAESALADMRRERDAAEAALLDVQGYVSLGLKGSTIVAICAARSRAKPDGEEKKL